MNPMPIIVFILILQFCIIVFLFWYANRESGRSYREIINENIALKEENKTLKEEKSNSFKKQQIDKWRPGVKCVVNMDNLSYGKRGEEGFIEFAASYTCEVLDVSEYKIQVKALEVTCNKSSVIAKYGKKGLIEYMEDKWITKMEADLIMDDAYHRVNTIQDIITNG